MVIDGTDNFDMNVYMFQLVATAVSGDSNALKFNRQQRIANELLETERNYVKRLHLVDQVCFPITIQVCTFIVALKLLFHSLYL